MRFFFEKNEENALSIREKYLFLHTFSEKKRRLKKKQKTVLSHDAGITQLVE